MRYISFNKQLLKQQKENEQLKIENEKRSADIDYIAMMCDIELEDASLSENADVEEEQIYESQSKISKGKKLL